MFLVLRACSASFKRRPEPEEVVSIFEHLDCKIIVLECLLRFTKQHANIANLFLQPSSATFSVSFVPMRPVVRNVTATTQTSQQTNATQKKHACSIFPRRYSTIQSGGRPLQEPRVDSERDEQLDGSFDAMFSISRNGFDVRSAGWCRWNQIFTVVTRSF